jgi:protein involved in polysaccharide export with SLBB domain
MISQAGGLDAEPGKQIYIFRQASDGGEAERLAVDLDQLVYRADAALNVALAPGDIVYVPAIEKVRIFVSGAAQSASTSPRDGPSPCWPTLAGSTTDRAAEKKVQVIRTKPDGTRLIIPVDLKRVKRGKIEDPVLQRDDLVLVPEAFF